MKHTEQNGASNHLALKEWIHLSCSPSLSEVFQGSMRIKIALEWAKQNPPWKVFGAPAFHLPLSNTKKDQPCHSFKPLRLLTNIWYLLDLASSPCQPHKMSHTSPCLQGCQQLCMHFLKIFRSGINSLHYDWYLDCVSHEHTVNLHLWKMYSELICIFFREECRNVIPSRPNLNKVRWLENSLSPSPSGRQC